ncbi:unnamed protein product [Rhizophagus irregularis]|uniref:Uncharacterized protein n=1 Tax=Rhizophagus irregularis TaxID=588596 RepID=A0A916E2C7_9GLOM|nr:unnamed protein product [Rhizophagus irregularis]CAB5099870.1 unnamed protein product [Rhizophagus irregularis]CAB5353775.1 unnamed protein product [Rhizophagus irregularis]
MKEFQDYNLLDLSFSEIRFLAPQNSVIYDKRSLDFWHSLENFRHSLGVEYMISGFSLSGVCSIYFQLRRTGL